MLQTLYYVPFKVVTQVAEREGISVAEIRSQHIFGKDLPCQVFGYLDIMHCWLPLTSRESEWFRAPIHFFVELKILNETGRLPSTIGYINWWKGHVHVMSEETIKVRVVMVNDVKELDNIIKELKNLKSILVSVWIGVCFDYMDTTIMISNHFKRI